MSSLLSRFAENIYWLGRYLERAESLARILDINETYARENSSGPNWRRILELNADTERFLKSHKKETPESVADFYVLDLTNPTSIAYAVSAARENARSVRHLISTEMWTQLNMFQYRMSQLTRRDTRLSNLATVCNEVKVNCQAFEGIAEGTYLRSEAWSFYHLGKYLERADQTTRILDMAYDQLTSGDGEALISVQADVLLRSVSGYHAFRTRHPGGSTPRDIAKFLLYDEEFPRAVALCVEQVTARLRDLERRHGRKRSSAIEAARRELEFSLETGLGDRITSDQLHNFIDKLQISLGKVSNAVYASYFD